MTSRRYRRTSTWNRHHQKRPRATLTPALTLLLYVLLCLPLVRVDQAIQDQRRIERAESEERRRQRKRRPYNVVDEADVVLARALGRRGTR